jgi:ferric-dicitrate binding protein FerR (iron transport regulator)
VKAAICARGVTGVFSTTDPQQSLEAIEKAMGVRLTYVTRFVALFHD